MHDYAFISMHGKARPKKPILEGPILAWDMSDVPNSARKTLPERCCGRQNHARSPYAGNSGKSVMIFDSVCRAGDQQSTHEKNPVASSNS